MAKTIPQLGTRSPLYNFFLNPYIIERFKRCPQCNEKTEPKKVPLVIHVDPSYPVSINYTCIYCAQCDLLIAHQKELEGYLTQMFMKSGMEAIGRDYLVIGTFDQAFWEQGAKTSDGVVDLFENLHSFKQTLDFSRRHGQHFNKPASQTPVQAPTGRVDDVESAARLMDAMKASLPISVRPTGKLLKMLRKQGYSIGERQTLFISSVFFGGDEGGITCDITPPEQNTRPVLCSLTQLEILAETPLAKEMRAYQEARKQKLAQLPDSSPSGFTIKCK